MQSDMSLTGDKMEQYELLWQCFMSDQMTAKQLDQHVREDSDFEKFVLEKVEILNSSWKD